MNEDKQEQIDQLISDFKNQNNILTLLYFVVAGVVLFSIYQVQNPMYYTPLFVGIILIAGALRSVARQFLYVPINKTLYQDCDPEVYHGAYLRLEQMERQTVYRRICVQGVANGIYYMGDHEGAIGYLKNNMDYSKCTVSQWLGCQNLLANCYACRPDLNALLEQQKELEAYQYKKLKKGEKYGLEACREIVAIYITLYSGEYDKALAMCQSRLERSSLTFQRIGLYYRIGYIHAMQKERALAEEYLYKVIKEGSKLCFAPKSRVLLAELQEYL